LTRPRRVDSLCPIEVRRALDSKREGMIEGVTLGNYLKLLGIATST
jgi:hypothetical protein